RHRGCQLIDSTRDEQKQGQFISNIRCPYHSWTYRLDGRLHHAPYIDVEKEKFSLHTVPLDCWGGFIFLNIGGGTRTLAEQLGPVPRRTSRYPLDELVPGWRREYRIAA